MDPNQQYPTTNPGSPYDFILSPQQSPKKRFSLGGNFAAVIGLLVGGGVLIIVVAALLLNTFSSSGTDKESLIGLAQTQTEIIRIARQGTDDRNQQATKNLAITIEVTTMTQQQGVLALLNEMGITPKDKDLALKQDAATDERLASARATSTFDTTFVQIIQKQLQDYAVALKQLHDSAKKQAERELIASYYNQVQLIITQVPSAP